MQLELSNSQAKAEKRELFLAMVNRTSREVDLKLAEVRGEKPKEKLVLEMDEEPAALSHQAKNLAARRSKGEASEVLKIIAREWVERHDLSRRNKKEKKTDLSQTSVLQKPMDSIDHDKKSAEATRELSGINGNS